MDLLGDSLPAQAQAQGVRAKPVLIGPVTYLALGKFKDGSDKLALLSRLLPVYGALLDTLAAQGVEWVQIDEPLLVTELDAEWPFNSHTCSVAPGQAICRQFTTTAQRSGKMTQACVSTSLHSQI